MGHSHDFDDVITDSSANETEEEEEEDFPSETDDDSDAENGGDESDDDDVMVLAESCPFSIDEKVLVYHNAHIYDAKVINFEFKNDISEWKVLVHYDGWSEEWDEWVHLDRLLKFTEENLVRQLIANEEDEQKDKNSDTPGSSQSKQKNNNGKRGRKRKNDSVVKGAICTDDLVSQMPNALKKQLVDDRESVTQHGKLVKLPRTPNVDDILKKYQEHRSMTDDLKYQSVEEITKGLRTYFNKVLLVKLLYKNERPQYEIAIAENVSPSSVYGAEHLLRLFVKMPQILLQVTINEETLKKLLQILSDFLKFLQQNQTEFFLSSYHVPEDATTSNSKQED